MEYLRAINMKHVIRKVKKCRNGRCFSGAREQEEIYIKGQMLAHRALSRCRRTGHMNASLDPLGETRPFYKKGPWLPKDQYDTVSFLPYSLHDMIQLPHNFVVIGGFNKALSVKDLFTKMKSVYAQSIGVEELQLAWYSWWLSKKMELRGDPDTSSSGFNSFSLSNTTSSKLVTLRRVIQAHSFEDWLVHQHPELTSGLGAEILSTALQSLTDLASLYNGQHFNISMSTKRGRLNVMLNALRKPPEQVLAPLQDFSVKGRYLDQSDRTSLGVNSSKVSSKSNDPLILNLLGNVNLYPDTQIGIIRGKTLSDQLFYRDIYRKKVWQVVIHDDRAFSSHGSVYEMMRLSFSPNYCNNGAIHIVISDQGKLASDGDMHCKVESQYCTDIAKATDALVLHVNASDINAVEHSLEIATEYMALFQRSVVVNLVCTPENRANSKSYFWKIVVGNSFTQSLIKAKKTSLAIIKSNIDSLLDLYKRKYNLREFNAMDWVDSPWKNAITETQKYLDPFTGITSDMLESGIKSYKDFCSSIKVHDSVKTALEKRNKLIDSGVITWIDAENLAIHTLIKHRVNVRLTGEEVLYPRDLSLSRYLKLEHESVPVTYSYMDGTIPTKAILKVSSSPASQNATLEFEVGFSSANPKSVAIWQGKSGSLSSIQYLLDVYIAGGEVRWLRQTSLVLLFLYDDNRNSVWKKEQCPWRILINSLDSPNITNDPIKHMSTIHMAVLVPTTPANYFHALIRQVSLSFRKPTAIFISNQLFASTIAVSNKEDLHLNTKFETLIADKVSNRDGNQVKRVILCCGMLYYDLEKERKSKNLENMVAIIRIEQICPFPYKLLAKELEAFPYAEIIWSQIEPKDGAWFPYVKSRIEAITKGTRECGYIGRKPSFYKIPQEDFITNLLEEALAF